MDDTTLKPRHLGIAVLLITIAYGVIFQRFYFTNSFIPSHDFNVCFVSGHIVTNYLVNAHLPLWAPEQNCGFPVWANAEVFPGFDPISLAVNFIFTMRGGNSVYAHVVTMFLWHLSFALGGLLLFRKTFGLSVPASLFGFTLLLFSSLTALNFRQPDDYISVYKYVPLLAYAAGRLCQRPSLFTSALLGVTTGLNVCGYQTPNVAVLVIFALLAGIPLFRGRAGLDYKMLAPAALVTLLMSMPFLVAGLFWVTNVALARRYFQLGYRGGLGDLLGPLAKYYPNETIIYIGIVPLLMGLVWLGKLIRGYLSTPAHLKPYWPDGFMVVFAGLVWIMHIGLPENFSGVDQPFLQMRSFNNMLPFVLFCLVYFAARQFESLERGLAERREAGQGGWRLRERPLLAVFFLVVCGTIFTELSRPSIFSLMINRYTADPKPEGGLISDLFIQHFSVAHWAFFILFGVTLFAVVYSDSRRSRPLFTASLLLLVVLDLALMNTKLLTRSNLYAQPNDRDELFPSLVAPMPQSPPEHRQTMLEINDEQDSEGHPVRTHWFKEGNILYHTYTATADPSYVWFRTQEYDAFLSSLDSQATFENLTGVTGPLLYYATRVFKVDREAVLPSLNQLFADQPLQSAIVVAKDDIPADYPDNTGEALAPGSRPAVVEFTPNSIKLKSELQRAAYLVYLDAYAAGWRAAIDGQESRIIRANYLFKAVLVPAGSHTVEFSYQPNGYLSALWCRLAGWVIGLALLVVGYKRDISLGRGHSVV